jgi:hypothetical protein
MMEAVAPGLTEGDVVGEGMRIASQRVPRTTSPSRRGPHSESFQSARLPSWDTNRLLEPGDLVHIDFWGPVRGYYTDFVRSTVVGCRLRRRRSCSRARSRCSTR